MTDLRIARRTVALLTLVMLTVVASLALATGPASADMVGLAGTRVAASTADPGPGVGPVGHVVAGQGRVLDRVKLPGFDRASGYWFPNPVGSACSAASNGT